MRNKNTNKLFRVNIITLLIVFIVATSLIQVSCSKKKEEVIKIGAVLALTGSAAEWGENQKKGMELAIKEINSGNGVKGKKIEMIVEDNKSEPKTAVIAFNKLMATTKTPIVYTLQSSISMALAPIANNNKVVLVCSAAHPDLLKSGEYTFRCYPTSAYITEIICNKLIPKLNIDEVYILFINDDFGVSMKDMFISKFKEQNGKIIGKDSFEKDQSDFRSTIAKVISKNPKALYIPGYGKALGKLLKQLKEFKYQGQIISTQEVSYVDVLSIAGTAADSVVYVDMPFDPKNENSIANNFVKNFIKEYGKEPILDAAIGYDMVKMLAEVLENYPYSSSGIKNGLLNIQKFNGILGELKVLPSREVAFPLVIKRIENRKPRILFE